MSGPAWSNVPAALVADPELSANAKVVALALGVHTNAAFTAMVSKTRIAETASISIGRAKRGTRELVESGWITVKQTRSADGLHDVNRYQWNYRQAGLAVERMAKGRAVRPVQKERGGRVTSDPRGRVIRDHGGRVTSDPHTRSFYTIGKTAASQRAESRAGGRPDPVALGEILGAGSPWAEAKAKLKRGEPDAQEC